MTTIITVEPLAGWLFPGGTMKDNFGGAALVAPDYSRNGQPTYIAGTVQTSGTSVTGTGTAFTTALSGQPWILIGSQVRRIASVQSNTAATLTSAFPSNIPPGSLVSKLRTTYGANGYTTRTWIGQPAGTRVISVPYPASITPNSITSGMTALDKLIRATTGNLLVFAHSQGAQVCSRWLRGPATKSNAPATSRVSFLLIGNPLRKYGGFGVGGFEIDGKIGLATPNNTGYAVTDCKLQYDGWADNPTKPGFWAWINATQDRGGINLGRAIHALGYRTANLDDPAKLTYTENTTTYTMLPHSPLIGLQRRIELSYNRPEN